MKLKIISLNCWFTTFFDEITHFFDSDDADILLLQEVTSGGEAFAGDRPCNGYQKLQQHYPDLYSAYAPMWRIQNTGEPEYQVGLALFSKYPLVTINSEYYYKNVQLLANVAASGGDKFPGVLLSAQVEIAPDTYIELITTHYIWTLHPETNQYQLEAMPLLINKLNTRNEYILGGDFNFTDVSPVYTELVKQCIDDRPTDLKQTIHPIIHKVGATKQLAVDYMFHKGDRISLKSSQVPVVPVSDHLPIIAEYEVKP